MLTTRPDFELFPKVQPLFTSMEPLSTSDLTEKLREIRQNCITDSSGFNVAAILQFKLKNGGYAYTAGVNFENESHNILSPHAEQNAICSAQALIDEPLQLDNVYVMGALKNATVGGKDGDTPCNLCGRCRQILLSFSSDKTLATPITLNGAVSPSVKLIDLIPDSFSERDLNITKQDEEKFDNYTTSPRMLKRGAQISDLIKTREALKSSDVLKYLRLIEQSSHVIVEGFKTTPLKACLMLIKQDDVSYYVPGVLMQDIAFHTTEATFSALGQAATRFGSKPFEIIEVNLIGNDLKVPPLSETEIRQIKRFSAPSIPVNYYTNEGAMRSYPLSGWWHLLGQDLFSRPAPNSAPSESPITFENN